MSAATTPGSTWQQRWQSLVGALVLVQSPREETRLIETLCAAQRTQVLAFVNAHAMNAAATDPGFFQAVASADVVLRDGSGVATLLSLLKRAPGINLNGTDLIPKLIARHAGRPIALFGTQEPYLSAARLHVVQRLAPGSPCETLDGFLDTRAYVEAAARQRPDLIVLGMGMPRQEQVAVELRAALAHPCLIVCGGAIIDFLGGKTARAPRWMRRTGLEWTFRLALEPRRLFRRYVIGNPLFLARALRLVAGSPRPTDSTAA